MPQRTPTSAKKASKAASRDKKDNAKQRAQLRAKRGALVASQLTTVQSAHQTAVATDFRDRLAESTDQLDRLLIGHSGPALKPGEAHLPEVMRSLPPPPDGQGLASGTGMRASVLEAVESVRSRGGDTSRDDLFAAVIGEAKESNSRNTEKELRAVAARELKSGSATGEALWRMLNWTADASNAIVGQMDDAFGNRPLVEVRKSPGKNDGVFATCDIPDQTYFTTYPCCGLVVPWGSRDECAERRKSGGDGDALFIAPELFPVAAGELNLNYAINVPIANHAGRQVQLVGHASQRHGMACGHLINDAFRPQDVGGEDAYNTLDESNCTACWSNGSVLMRSTRFVPKGRELLFRYGADHWIDRAEFTTQEATGEATGS